MKNLEYTFEMARDVALGYSSKKEFQSENPSLFKWVYRRNMWQALSAHMVKPGPKRKWTPEAVWEEAQKFSKKSVFAKSASGAYAASLKLGIVVEVCRHMQRRMLPCEVVDGRICKKCFQHKTPDYFVAAKDLKSGYGSICKRCHVERTAKYASDNPAWKRGRTALRRSKRANAAPKWLTRADHVAIEQIYQRARWLSEATCIPHEVDHIIPISGKLVCGLHVPWNLQVLPMIVNREKSNSFCHV